uniref:Bromodomain testis-specific protein-like isoform X1 n=1 Tax=Petromyzon marinus TaxID=7757 RepID=A0AAJ7TKA1_PETMA|nr:bromodomain testis-specific protein-like isoform X1 [Petromyzon marinus]
MPLGKADTANIWSEYGPQCKVVQTASAIYLTKTDDKTDTCISGTTCIIESKEMTYLVMCADEKLETICHIEDQTFLQTPDRTLEFESWKGRKMVLSFGDEEELDKLAGSLPPHLVKRKENTTSKISFRNKMHLPKLRWLSGRSLDVQPNIQRKKKQTPEAESKAPKPGPPPPKPPPLSTLPSDIVLTMTSTRPRNGGQQQGIASPASPPSPEPTRAQNEDAVQDTKCHLKLQQCPICHCWYPFGDIIWHASACGEHGQRFGPLSAAEHT